MIGNCNMQKRNEKVVFEALDFCTVVGYIGWGNKYSMEFEELICNQPFIDYNYLDSLKNIS